ncbi:hypothetical protein ESY87_06510 [Subsaximicrobium wynnwilliamsii]|uniref:hypothetical protein n=1 Tax=Subsaximicrobium wynnwilliamsii TaxID=291179 RepID=UPI0011BE6CBD|nr:hypothetical protein [Subsaximicrobium wynnwilliamsii]TXD84154.1 hypothetical protein ESY87_06510 [Subsaximicrobium wynnwilliamsii]TXE03866.1 hypothetical protein ESY88_06505 [Subsaximicrobium wynnwilliamsii]
MNRFYKGFFSTKTKDAKCNIELSRIIAIQIIGEIIRGDKNKYNGFELNLVVDDANRLKVIDHGNLKASLQITRP